MSDNPQQPSTNSSPSIPGAIIEQVIRPAHKTKEEWQQEEMVRTALNLMRKGSCDSFQMGYVDDKIDVVLEIRLVSVKRLEPKAG
jgi:hypothetical protein